MRELAQFRESYAQTRNVPRSRVFKDDALLELASTKPGNLTDLGRSRLLLREARKGEIAEGILKAVADGMACKPEDQPKANDARAHIQVDPALADMLRVLLKAKSEQEGIAPRMIASAANPST